MSNDPKKPFDAPPAGTPSILQKDMDLDRRNREVPGFDQLRARPAGAPARVAPPSPTEWANRQAAAPVGLGDEHDAPTKVAPYNLPKADPAVPPNSQLKTSPAGTSWHKRDPSAPVDPTPSAPVRNPPAVPLVRVGRLPEPPLPPSVAPPPSNFPKPEVARTEYSPAHAPRAPGVVPPIQPVPAPPPPALTMPEGMPLTVRPAPAFSEQPTIAARPLTQRPPPSDENAARARVPGDEQLGRVPERSRARHDDLATRSAQPERPVAARGSGDEQLGRVPERSRVPNDDLAARSAQPPVASRGPSDPLAARAAHPERPVASGGSGDEQLGRVPERSRAPNDDLAARAAQPERPIATRGSGDEQLGRVPERSRAPNDDLAALSAQPPIASRGPTDDLAGRAQQPQRPLASPAPLEDTLLRTPDRSRGAGDDLAGHAAQNERASAEPAFSEQPTIAARPLTTRPTSDQPPAPPASRAPQPAPFSRAEPAGAPAELTEPARPLHTRAPPGPSEDLAAAMMTLDAELDLPPAPEALPSPPPKPGRAPAKITVVGQVKAAPAGLFRRSVSWLVDLIVITGVVSALMFVAVTVISPAGGAKLQMLEKVALPAAALTTLIAFVYSALFAFLWQGRTFGRRLVGIHLVDNSGSAPGPVRALFRAMLSVVSFAFFLSGFWLALFDRKGQTLHDKLSRTFVVRLAADAS